jgi:hypothetical protein
MKFQHETVDVLCKRSTAISHDSSVELDWRSEHRAWRMRPFSIIAAWH